MSVLLLRFAGPLQSWGDSSRFNIRGTRREPTKSGVVGFLSAALGRGREENVDDLVALKMAVRSDQPGSIIEDFQTAEKSNGAKMPLTRRFYLADAVFVVALEGERPFLETIRKAISSPAFPLYLGRRSCTPTSPIVLDLVDMGLIESLMPANTPWQASDWFSKTTVKSGFRTDLVFDFDESDEVKDGYIIETCTDVPLSFDQTHRRYARRTIARTPLVIREPELQVHDPLGALEA